MDVLVRALMVGTERTGDPGGGHQVEVTRVQCYHDSLVVEPWEYVDASLDAAVERVAKARPCRTCEGSRKHPPGDEVDRGCGNCRDGSRDGRKRIRAILLASGLFCEGGA